MTKKTRNIFPKSMKKMCMWCGRVETVVVDSPHQIKRQHFCSDHCASYGHKARKRGAKSEDGPWMNKVNIPSSRALPPHMRVPESFLREKEEKKGTIHNSNDEYVRQLIKHKGIKYDHDFIQFSHNTNC